MEFHTDVWRAGVRPEGPLITASWKTLSHDIWIPQKLHAQGTCRVPAQCIPLTLVWIGKKIIKKIHTSIKRGLCKADDKAIHVLKVCILSIFGARSIYQFIANESGYAP